MNVEEPVNGRRLRQQGRMNRHESTVPSSGLGGGGGCRSLS